MAELRSSDVLSKQSQINQSFDGRIADLEGCIADLEGFLKIQRFKINLDFGHSAAGGEISSQILPEDKQEIINQMSAEHVIGGCYAYTGNNKTGTISNYEYVSLTKIKETSEGLYCVFGDSYSLQWHTSARCFLSKKGIPSNDTGCLILLYIQ